MGGTFEDTVEKIQPLDTCVLAQPEALLAKTGEIASEFRQQAVGTARSSNCLSKCLEEREGPVDLETKEMRQAFLSLLIAVLRRPIGGLF